MPKRKGIDVPNERVLIGPAPKRRNPTSCSDGNGQESPPWLCAIYFRDVLSFLARTTVEECRRVSNQCRLVIAQCSARELPRHKMYLLSIRTVPAEECNVTKSGFIGSHSADGSWKVDGGRLWHRLRQVEECCRDGNLKELSDRLTDQLIFPKLPGDDGVVLSIQPCFWKGTTLSYRVLNRLTEATAFHLVHFIRHVEPALAFQYAEIYRASPPTAPLPPNSAEGEFAVNPEILAQLSVSAALGRKPRLCVKNLACGARLNHDNGSLHSFKNIFHDFGLLRATKLTYNMVAAGGRAELSRLLPVIAVADYAQSGVKKVWVGLGWGFQQSQMHPIDQVVRFFLKSPTMITPAINMPLIHFHFAAHYNSAAWPTTCPRGAALRVREFAKKKRLTFEFATSTTNPINSNQQEEEKLRKLRVVLIMCQEKITQFRLHFM